MSFRLWSAFCCALLLGEISSAQEWEWNIQLDLEVKEPIHKYDSIEWKVPYLEEEEERGPDIPGPGQELLVSIEPTGLVIVDTDDSHEIYVFYTPDRKHIEVVIYARFEIFRKQFPTADVQGPAGSQGFSQIAANGGDDSVHYMLDIPAFIDGGAGDDQIRGGDGGDAISGGQGNDQINGGWGRDLIHGGAGNDDLEGGIGMDLIHGGSGDDFIHAMDGELDVVRGGTGRDVFWMDLGEPPFDFDPSEDAWK